MKSRRHVPIFHQLAETECGLCCCLMLLRYYYSNESYTDIQEELYAGRDGISIKQMKKFLELRNFDVKVAKIKELEKMEKDFFPFIAFVDENHYVVVESYKKGKVTINDPGKGRGVFSIDVFKERFSGISLFAIPNENYEPVKKKAKSPWLYVIETLRDKKLLLALILFIMAGIYFFMLRVPIWVQNIVDNVIAAKETAIVYKYVGIIVLSMLLYAFLVLIRCNRMIVLNLCLGEKIEAKTYRKMLRLPYTYFESRSSGDILQRLTSSISVREMLSNQFLSGILDLGAIIVLSIYMIRKSILLSIVSFSIWLFNVIVLMWLRPKLSKSTDDEVATRTKAQSLQVEALYSISAIKVSSMENEVYDRWKEVYNEIMEKYKKRVWIGNLNTTFSGSIQTFGPLFVLLVGILEAIEGRLTIGEVIAFYSIASNFFGFSNSIISTFSQIIIMNTYMERLNEIWQKKEMNLEEGKKDFKLSGNITLKDVTFQYSPNSKPALSKININVEAGMKVALVGVSGSGKSTLSRIMLGLYPPTEGEVYYDGMELNTLNRATLSKQIGIVPQDSMLFNKTILENIKMNSNKTLEEVQEAAKLACIHDEIMEMPMGYYTLISEMGINLSGGQRQRLLLARALLTEPKILLLDEATSSLDYINEKNIMEHLKARKCTRLVIAHRLSTIIDSDIIFMLQDGQLIAQGKHEELLEKCAEYKSMYSSGN